MINFFRKKRKNLADENKSIKYMRYAFGEIALVVVGILIALSINNWNERKKLLVEEQKLISALIKEIESNIEKLEITINTNQNLLNGSNTFLKKAASNNRFEYNVSKIPILFAYASNKIESSILKEVLGTDSRALISNQKYLEQLRDLKRSYDISEKTEFYVDEYWNSQVVNFLNNSGLGIYMSGDDHFKDKKIDFEITNLFLSSLSIMNGYQEALLISRRDMATALEDTLILLKKINQNN
jgi:uncharacterized protein DUF6090